MKDDAFLSAIHADPDDESLRLIYADWLDEHGDDLGRARAELIRAQCELERLPPDDERRPGLEKRVRRLVKDHGKVWTEPMRKTKLGKDWQFRRGFPEAVTLPAHVRPRRRATVPPARRCGPSASRGVQRSHETGRVSVPGTAARG
jgi:uncharacterized protein (TIGR02996 family)